MYMHCKAIHIILIMLLAITPGIGQVDIPDAPEFKVVSVDPLSNPTETSLHWTPSDSADVEGYYIYLVQNGITNTLDSVEGRLTDSYTNFESSASAQKETYRIAAYDTLDFKSRITDPHTTIYCFPYYDICALEVKLSWNHYEGWENGIESYDVYRKEVGDDYDMIATVAGENSNYYDTEIAFNSQYCYYVIAHNSDGRSSSSNETCVYTSSYEPPEYMRAEFATVDDDKIYLRFAVDTAGETMEYHLMRSTDMQGGYQRIATIPDADQLKVEYADENVSTDTRRYFYKLRAVTPCGNVSAESNIASNIVLRGDKDEQLSHNLSWNAYEDWEFGVDRYRIYRNYGETSFQSVGTSAQDILTYKGNIAGLVNQLHASNLRVPSKFCYFVEAVRDTVGDSLQLEAVSQSNKLCLYHLPRLWMPNAFNPSAQISEENRLFKPVISFIPENGYVFTVYDRWGQKIYQSLDPTEGWDGSTGKRNAKNDRFVYQLQYMNYKNEKKQKTGVFFILY